MDLALVKYQKGMAAFENKKLDDALSFFEASTELKANFTDALYHLGIVYELQNDQESANRYFRLAFIADPDRSGAHNRLP